MENKFWRLTLLIVFAFSLILTGCSPSNSSDELGISEGDKKDELIMAIGTEPETGFDPTTGWGRYGSPLFQSTLLKMDDKLTIVNDLAT